MSIQDQPKANARLYFPNLNGVRCIAALMVVGHHIEQLKGAYGFDNIYYTQPVRYVGRLGVILFFVLSGYLITSLLVAEENSKGTINVKQFYIRRVLRIWPLYYWIVLCGTVIGFLHLLPLYGASSPHYYSESIGQKLTLFIAFLPNLCLALYGVAPFIAQTWSVGTEEQFYLVWPWLFRNKKIRRDWLMIGIVALYLAIKVVLQLLAERPGSWHIVSDFWSMFAIDCMAIGGLLALWKGKIPKAITNVLFNKSFQLLLLAITCGMIGLGVYVPVVHQEVYAALFGLIILNLSANPKNILNLEYEPFMYLGKISYGLYMYHILAIAIVLSIVKSLGLGGNTIIYPCSIAATLLFASLSYRFLEEPFIRRKVRYSAVVSGENAREENQSH